MIKKILSAVGEEVKVVKKFERLTPIKVEKKSLFGSDKKALSKAISRIIENRQKDEKRMKKRKKNKSLDNYLTNFDHSNVIPLMKGDCIIAFSKTEIYNLKKTIERCGFKCSLIYGALPPLTRLQFFLFFIFFIFLFFI